MGRGDHSNGEPQIDQMDHGGDPRKPRPAEARRKSGRTAWQTNSGCSGSGIGWGGMENCGIRSRQVVGNGDGGRPHVYGYMEEGGDKSTVLTTDPP